MTKSAAHMVFIPVPAVGHLISTVEIAKLLLARDQRLSITMILMKVPYDNPKINSYSQTLSSVSPRFHFVDLPLDDSAIAHLQSISRYNLIAEMVEIHKVRVQEMISGMINESILVAVVVDMFCTPFVDVARELGLPSYVFLTSGAGFLGLALHLHGLRDDQIVDFSEVKGSDIEFDVPTFVNRVPARVLPSDVLDNKTHRTSLLIVPRWFRRADGILVNTFAELEPHAIEALSKDSNIPRVYPVGPLLKLTGNAKDAENEVVKKDGLFEAAIMNWLDDQPPSSVVYLCFGSLGSFENNQNREIALALENVKCRFLWSVRMASRKPEADPYDDFLPKGFLERTAGMGMVMSWAPQIAILSHPAVGGFVSHGGWNSMLESLWFGVPLITWPRYAEQHINSFQLVHELGLAMEIKIDNSQNNVIVTSDEIEIGIRQLMDPIESVEIRENVKQMKERSRGALQVGGSSYTSMGRFIEDLISDST